MLQFYRILQNDLLRAIPNKGFTSFVKYCSIMSTQEVYRDYVDSMITFYAIHKHSEYIKTKVNIQLLINVLQSKGYLSELEIILLSSRVDEKYTKEISKEEYFMKLLRSKSPQFHLELLSIVSSDKVFIDLHTRISNSISELKTMISLDNFAILENDSMTLHNKANSKYDNSPLDLYKNYLRNVYSQSVKILAEDWPPNPHLHFVNLALITLNKRQKESKPHTYSILFARDKNYDFEMLTEPKKIFHYQKVGHQVILIEGNAGSGKTTLANKLCKDWANYFSLNEFSHFILLKLRDPRIAKSSNLNEIISLQLGRPALDVVESITACHGAGFAIWLEGWDELCDSHKSDSVFSDLISGTLLPEATIVVTTRPSATGSLEDGYITRRIEILGFTEEQMNEYVDRSFSCNNENVPTSESKDFKMELKRVPNLLTLAYIPLSLCILVHVFKSCKYQLPSTLTEVYLSFLLITLQRHKEKTTGSKKRPITSLEKLPPDLHHILIALQKLAYCSLLQGQLTFSEDDIADALFDSQEIPWNFDGMGLFEVLQLDLLTGVSRSFNFLHKTIQELLAALYLSRLSLCEQNIELKLIFGESKFEMVWLFYAGLTKMKKFSVERVFPVVKTECDLPEFDPSTHRSLTSIWHSSHEYYVTLTKESVTEHFLLTLIICCYESQDPLLCKSFCDHFYNSETCCIDLPASCATPQVMLSLSYFIAHTSRKWSLYSGVTITSGIQLLCRYLCDPQNPQGRLWRFCYVVTNQEKDDLCMLIQMQPHLQWLYLSFSSSLRDDGVKRLCNSLAHNTAIMKLHINSCNITSDGLVAVSDMLKNNESIQQLDIRGNLYVAKNLTSFLKCIKYYNNTLSDLFLDQKYEHNSKVMQMKDEINGIRKSKNAKELFYWFA